MVALLPWLELPLLVLRAIAPIPLLRSVQLSCGWGTNHAILQRSTARPTTSRGSRHDPLPLLLFGLSTCLHGSFLVDGSTSLLVLGQVGEHV
jgi:hypothetical protein